MYLDKREVSGRISREIGQCYISSFACGSVMENVIVSIICSIYLKNLISFFQSMISPNRAPIIFLNVQKKVD